MRRRGVALRRIHDQLLALHGPQGWWPAETPFEVMVGAILTQNTAWTNVEQAIARLGEGAAIEPEAILALRRDRLARLIRPAGYYNVKAERLRSFCRWFVAQGGFEALQRQDTASLRRGLLGVRGVGPETADDMLLYAFERPVFVIDAYTRRLFSRLGLITGEEDYETLRHWFEASLGPDVALYQEYHGLIVAHAKDPCRVRPGCEACGLRRRCRGPGAGGA